MDDLPGIADQLNLPNSLLLPVTFGLSIYSAVRMLAEQFAPVAKALGPLGRRWMSLRQQRIAKAANVADLTARVDKLTDAVEVRDREIEWLRRMRDSDAYTQELMRQVDGLTTALERERGRREMTDAYLDYDIDWHRQADIAWLSSGDRDSIAAAVPAHTPLIAFARKWHAERGQDGPG